jgi:hypothetical protein
VIEDEPLIAINIAATLEQQNARISGPAATVSDALRIIEDNDLDDAWSTRICTARRLMTLRAH